jgi:hypothetical protein
LGGRGKQAIRPAMIWYRATTSSAQIDVSTLTLTEPEVTTYTVWSHGRKLGETTFEMESKGRHLAGVFQPTAAGIELLPGITAMMPALFDLHALYEREGVNTDDDDPDAGAAALALFDHAPEGKRLLAAAKQIASLELRDPAGKVVSWKSLLISDVQDILRLAADSRDPDEEEPSMPDDSSPPIRYMISVTLGRGSAWEPDPFRLPLGARGGVEC